MTAAARRVAQEQADAVLEEIERCLGRIDSLPPDARTALWTTAAAMLAEDTCPARYRQAFGRLLEALAARAEPAASARAGAPGQHVSVAASTSGRVGITPAKPKQAPVSGAAAATGAAR